MNSMEGLRSSVANLRAMARDILDKTAQFDGNDEPTVTKDGDLAQRKSGDLRQLRVLAEEEYRHRRARETYFDVSLFGEPAWDILLDLFVQRIEGKLVSVSSVSIASGVPNTTALRWIGLLEQREMVRRVASPTDKRVSWIEIKDTAFDLVASTLRARLHARQCGS